MKKLHTVCSKNANFWIDFEDLKIANIFNYLLWHEDLRIDTMPKSFYNFFSIKLNFTHGKFVYYACNEIETKII